MRSRLLVLVGVAFVAFLCTAGPAFGAPSAPATPTIEINMPSTGSGIGFKDLLAPIGTLIGAALGFGGAITAARLAAQRQDRRTRQEQANRRFDEERTRRVQRLESFADEAGAALRSVVELARVGDQRWTESDAKAARVALRLTAAQLLGASRILPGTELDAVTQQFVTTMLAVCSATTATAAQPLIQRSAGEYDALLQAVRTGLDAATQPVSPPGSP